MLVDYREDTRRIERVKAAGFPVDVDELQYSDYCWCGADGKTWALEHKSVGDYLSSVASGRLHDQLAGMTQTYDHCILNITGTIRTSADGIVITDEVGKTKWRYNSLTALECSIWMRGVFVSKVDSDEAFVLALGSYYELARRGLEKGGYKVQKKNVFTFSQEAAAPVRILAQFDRVGEERAKLLLSRFSTLRGVFDASEKQLVSVRTIGKVTAASIRQTLDSTEAKGL